MRRKKKKKTNEFPLFILAIYCLVFIARIRNAPALFDPKYCADNSYANSVYTRRDLFGEILNVSTASATDGRKGDDCVYSVEEKSVYFLRPITVLESVLNKIEMMMINNVKFVYLYTP